MAKYLLTSTEYFKANSVTDTNVPDKIIIQAIQDAQMLFLEPLIGYNLFTKLCVDGFNLTLTEPYLTFNQDFVLPFLMKAIEYEAILKIILRETSQGLIKNKNDDKELSTIQDYHLLKGELEEKIDMLGDKILKYLSYNSVDFPEYVQVSYDRTNVENSTMGQLFISSDVQASVRNQGSYGYNNQYGYNENLNN